MKRITILGNPGAGKTTFARALAKKTGLPVHHLDYYYHQKGTDYSQDKEAWLALAKKLTSKDQWISEGNYSTTYPARIPESDLLIFMDVPTWLSVWSVLKRRWQYRSKTRAEMPDDWVEKIDPIFFWYVLQFRSKSRKDVVEGIQQHKHDKLQILTFKSRKAAYEWLDTQ